MRVGEHGRREEVRSLKSTEMPPYEAPEDRASLGKRRAPKRGQCSTLVLCRSPPFFLTFVEKSTERRSVGEGRRRKAGDGKEDSTENYYPTGLTCTIFLSVLPKPNSQVILCPFYTQRNEGSRLESSYPPHHTMMPMIKKAQLSS